MLPVEFNSDFAIAVIHRLLFGCKLQVYFNALRINTSFKLVYKSQKGDQNLN